MSITVHAIELIVSDPAVRHGRPVIAGTGICVSDRVCAMLFHKQDADGIAHAYDLSLAQVHAALSYYYANKESIDAEIREQIRTRHAVITDNVYRGLYEYVTRNEYGDAYSDDLTYALEYAEDGHILKSRIPDVSFIRKGRFPENFDKRRPFPGVPDLAVEVVSPGESAEDLHGKITDYQQKGTEEIWVLYPEQKKLHRYVTAESDTIRIYKESDTLEPDKLFPGLKCAINDFFFIPDFED